MDGPSPDWVKSHGQASAQGPRGLRRLTRARPHREAGHDDHTVVTGDPDARKSGPSGSEGGRAEKALPSRDLAARPALPRTLLDEWAYLRPYTSNDERTAALTGFLRADNHHRCHTALGGQPPISRVDNAPGQYI